MPDKPSLSEFIKDDPLFRPARPGPRPTPLGSKRRFIWVFLGFAVTLVLFAVAWTVS